MTEEIKEILDKLKYIVDFSIIEHDTSFNSDNVEENVCLLTSNECQLLLDCITNLQQNYNKLQDDYQEQYTYEYNLRKQLQHDLEKANDIIEKDRQFYKCRMDEYVELKKENEFLKLNNPEMNIEHFRIVKENKRKIDNLRKENERLKEIIKDNTILVKDENGNYQECNINPLDYKSRCEKAKEYINHENFKRTILVGVGTKKYTRNILDNVLNILNGSDEE